MIRTLLIIGVSFLSVLFSHNAMACDDKPCEAAYLSTTEQYAANSVRHANAYRVERLAYSKNRERRDYALYVHKHLIKNSHSRSNKEKMARHLSKN